MQISEKYRIIERLSESSRRKFGQLFIAESKHTGEKYVLKAVSKSHNSILAEERLINESKFNFDYKGLPLVSDFQETDSELLLVRNFVRGQTLDEFWKQLKKKERIPFMLDFFQQLVPIWNHLNQKNVVHCDLKPGNIIIYGSKYDFEISLIDFALALKTDDIEERKIVFPLGYAAPELLLNRLTLIDQRTDMFALGIAFWKLWSGQLPLTHANPSIFTNLQLTHPLPSHPNIPKKVQVLLERMTVKHQFKIPPNKMDSYEVDNLLKEAMTARINSIDEVIEELKKPQKKWFFLP